jgi:hypothetical protein
MELIFEVREAEEGGYVARALGQAIFTEAETWRSCVTTFLKPQASTSKMQRKLPSSYNCIL